MNKIEYHTRYSDTDEFDSKGRWARLAVYNNIRIAWIDKQLINGKMVFFVKNHFPTMQNDTANEIEHFYTLDEAKDYLSKKWKWFLTNVNKEHIKSECDINGHIFVDTSHYVVTSETDYEHPITGETVTHIDGYTKYEETCKICDASKPK